MRKQSLEKTPIRASGVSPAQAKQQVREAEKSVHRVKAIAPPRETKGIFKAACSTDLLFLIDTTSSMGDYINTAKAEVKSIVDNIKGHFLNESEVRVSVIGYKDHDNKYDDVHIQFIDFTTSTDDIYHFLDGLDAYCGGDWAEDVLGGVQQALRASWRHQTRCIIHIADAPPHGNDLHDLAANWDNYHTPGSEPHRLRYHPLLHQLIQMRINYAFLHINYTTDRMAFEFSKLYAEAGAETSLLAGNKYHNDNKVLPRTSKALGPQLIWEELELGTDLQSLRRLVVQTVTKSISSTANRLSLALNARGKSMSPYSQFNALKSLGAIHENQSSSNNIQLEKVSPRWEDPGWLDMSLLVEGFCPDVVHNASTLDDMLAADENIKLGFTELSIHARSLPFDKGAMRTASYARTASSSGHFVLKSFIKKDKELAHFIEDMRIQALSKSFALEFNSLLKLPTPIDFVVTTTVRPKKRVPADEAYSSLEPFIAGEYIKYNGNNAFVLEDASNAFLETAQAFSHFTFERSWGHVLINDLQGVGNVLTDPSIQTKYPERYHLSDTNLGEDGFKFWFSSHRECNSICRTLELKSTAQQLMDGNLQFREMWPTMEPTTCCSSKLCRRIIRLANARHYESEALKEFRWCDDCFVQLERSMTRQTCAHSEPTHDFDISDFFHESQGQISPNVCPEHREKDTTKATAAALGANLFNSSRANVQKTGMISGRNW
jgi:hypothetical protein